VKGTCPHCGKEEQYGDSCEACSATYSPADLKDAHCATCGCRALETRETEHILFDLAKFKEYLRGWLPDHTQADVANKLQEWFGEDQTLLPWDISRDAPYFGFEIPGYPGKYFYVWLDAPVGYLASLKNWCGKNGRTFEGTWGDPAAERYHFIGKDIVRFHCLFWPAMLHAAGYQGPSKVFVHGFLTVNGEKMSKSRGTFVSARTYLDHLDPAFLRYYYACKINNTTDDIDLNLDDFAQRVNSDLVGKITNLASRGAQMLGKKLDGRLGSLDDEGRELLEASRARAAAIADLYEARKFSQVPVEVCKLADAANEYFDRHAPWKAIKEDPEAVRPVLTTVLNLFRVLAIYLAPILPVYAKKAAALFGEESFTWDSLGKTLENAPIGEYEYLATRVDPKAVEAMVEASKPPVATGEGAAAPSPNPTPQGAPTAGDKQVDTAKSSIEIDDFAKVDLRIGKVLSCTAVPKSKKLVKFELDCGPLGKRTIFSGIRMAYPDPSVLDGKQVVFVANLAPREMKGVGVSEGMVLCAGDPATGLAVLAPLAPVNPGDPVT
jgi:methionyl-tRNA synthetase